MNEREAWNRGYRDAMHASIGRQGTPLHMGAAFPTDWESRNPYPAGGYLGIQDCDDATESIPHDPHEWGNDPGFAVCPGVDPALVEDYEAARAGLREAERQVREIRDGIEALADDLAQHRDELRTMQRERNGNREGSRRIRPDVDNWADAYEVVERQVRALSGVSGPTTEAGDE